MNDALQRFSVDLASRYWWLTAVVVAVVINVVSGYLKGVLDVVLANKRKAQEEQKDFTSNQRFLEALQTALSPQLLPYATQRETRLWFIALFLFLGAILALAIMAAISPFQYELKDSLRYLLFSLGSAAFLLTASSMSMANEALRQAGTNYMARSLMQSHSPDTLKEFLQTHERKLAKDKTYNAKA